MPLAVPNCARDNTTVAPHATMCTFRDQSSWIVQPGSLTLVMATLVRMEKGLSFVGVKQPLV